MFVHSSDEKGKKTWFVHAVNQCAHLTRNNLVKHEKKSNQKTQLNWHKNNMGVQKKFRFIITLMQNGHPCNGTFLSNMLQEFWLTKEVEKTQRYTIIEKWTFFCRKSEEKYSFF